MNYLAIIPIYGAVILLFWLFIKMARGEIDKKRFHEYFISSALVGFLSILISILFLNFINSLIDITNFINSYGILIASIAGGYLMNFFTITATEKANAWSYINRAVSINPLLWLTCILEYLSMI